MPPPPFENFLLDALNSEQKPSVKNRSTGRPTGVDFEIYQSGRVKKILTGSTSDDTYYKVIVFVMQAFVMQ